MSETNFTKLFSSITASTIWSESAETKVVWITMLAMSDAVGYVYASVPGLAKIAGVSMDDTIKALDLLLSPDKWSRDKDNEGRRIEEIDGGWAILNHPKYRKRRDAEERRAYHREYMRKKRESVKSGVKNVKDCEPQLTQGEGEAEEDTNNAPAARVKTPRSSPVPVSTTTTLQGQIKQRWRDIPSIAQWDNFFDAIGQSRFLSGRTPAGNGRSVPFIATLLWVTKETNFAKIAAGEYD